MALIEKVIVDFSVISSASVVVDDSMVHGSVVDDSAVHGSVVDDSVVEVCVVEVCVVDVCVEVSVVSVGVLVVGGRGVVVDVVCSASEQVALSSSHTQRESAEHAVSKE